jgi:hypothetical protein
MRFTFHARTTKPFDRFRFDLEKSIGQSFASSVMRRVWHDRTLRMKAPGAEGSVRFDEGDIRAEVSMSFPATLIKHKILDDIRRTMADASGGAVRMSGG